MDRNELIKTGLLLYLCENSKIRLEKMILVLTRLQNLCLCEGCVEHFVGHSDY